MKTVKVKDLKAGDLINFDNDRGFWEVNSVEAMGDNFYWINAGDEGNINSSYSGNIPVYHLPEAERA